MLFLLIKKRKIKLVLIIIHHTLLITIMNKITLLSMIFINSILRNNKRFKIKEIERLVEEVLKRIKINKKERVQSNYNKIYIIIKTKDIGHQSISNLKII